MYRPLTRREIAIIFAFWTLLAVMSSVNWLLDPRAGLRPIDPSGPISLAFIESWTWAVLTPVIFRLSNRFSLRRVALLIVIGAVISIGVFLLLGYARFLLLPPARNRGYHGLSDVARLRFAPQLLSYFAILAAGYAREYFLRDQERQAHATQLQTQLAEARLNALRMQVNPHFLFNTLNAVSALVERDPSGVRKMIARLSELLRTTIDSKAEDEVPLRQELELLDRYIAIMEVRFQGRLRVERDVDPSLLDVLVPNLILQPIVENALEHGASRALGEGVVQLDAHRDGESLVIKVRDNGPGVTAEREGVGVGNTRARLAQLYGDRGAMRLKNAEGGGAIAEVVVPLHSSSERR